ncbi:MAG: restriction endonuclease [Clostridia bacterium]|nr:restriction endonuclease [Clostridia bacterium]
MKITNKTKERCIACILEYLKDHTPATKKDIIYGALLIYGLTPRELESASPRSKHGLIKTYMNTAFNSLLNKKDIKKEGEFYYLAKNELVFVSEDECQAQILRLLGTRPYVKHDLYLMLDKVFGTVETSSLQDDNALHSLAGNILSNLVETNRIEVVSGKYQLKKMIEFEDKDNTPLSEEIFKERLYKRLWLLGGKYFEEFCANVLERYFTMTGQFVIFCDVTGGSDDGGIDILLETIDGLGFYEKIMVQTKCRDHASITETEVRSFYGSLNVLGGSRGIFITSTDFHPGAKKLLDSIDNCIGIDGDTLFELIKKTEYGICKVKNGYTFDTSVFAK